jgi:hypothetical protein
VAYECVPRPNCPACGAEWDDEMVALFDMAMGLGCNCCRPYGMELPDIVCHQCKKVLYTTNPPGLPPDEAPASPAKPDDLDMTPRS